MAEKGEVKSAINKPDGLEGVVILVAFVILAMKYSDKFAIIDRDN